MKILLLIIAIIIGFSSCVVYTPRPYVYPVYVVHPHYGHPHYHPHHYHRYAY